jgi:phosphomannomutase
MERIFLFDVDGTLTNPRELMHPDFEKPFRELVANNVVYLASGSDLGKIREQVPADILERCAGVFSSSANQLNIGSQLVYKNELAIPEELSNFLNSSIEKSKYKTKTGNHIEYRPGMINFSIVGRNANNEQRKEYYTWDVRELERKKIAILLMATFPNLDVKIGGEISIDIYPEGYDKRQSVKFIKETHPDAVIRFFGDKTEENGNDYSVVISLDDEDRVHSVKKYQETKKLILSYLKGELF